VDSNHIRSMITSLFTQRRHRNQRGNKLGSYKYLGAAIGIHDIMLGAKEELKKVDLVKCVFICSGQRSFDVTLCLMSNFS